MRIYVDADACPVIPIVEYEAEKNNIAVTLLCDTNHVLDSDYSEVKVIGAVYKRCIHGFIERQICRGYDKCRLFRCKLEFGRKKFNENSVEI